MPTVFLSPIPAPGSPLFIPGGNAPASGGLLFQYATGTSNKLNTYTTSSGAVANANPIVLDSGGNLTGSREVWLIQSSSYRFVLAPSNDQDPPLSPYWTLDSISGLNDTSGAVLNVSSEWVSFAGTPVFSNASTFTLGGDQTATFTPGRRVKTINNGGTVYGTITSSVFVSSTTIFVITDSGNIDSGISAVSYGLLGGGPSNSIPWINNVTSTGFSLSHASVTTGVFTATSYAVWGTGVANFGTITKRKTADQSCTTTFANDNDLTFSIAASEEWVGEYLMDGVDSGAAGPPGYKLAVTVPSGALMKLEVTSITRNPATSSNEPFTDRTEVSGTGISFTPAGASSGGIIYGVRGKLWVLNSTTPGSVNLQIGCVVNNATVLTFKRGSHMTFTRLA